MRALISVTDKTGIAEFAGELVKMGCEIVSTGGTAKVLREAGIKTVEVSDLTGFPEMLDGRVKTLHPKIFGGILYIRNNSSHEEDVKKHGIPAVDIVICNLYPFERISIENKLQRNDRVEYIDIGGVSLLRAAGKNFADVIVLCDANDYPAVLKELKENKTVSLETRRRLTAKAFAHTAHYDSMIASFFRESSVAGNKIESRSDAPADVNEIFPDELSIGLRKLDTLRYGENPHQKAAIYKESNGHSFGVVHAEKLQGKELSFNNYLDLDSAWLIPNLLDAGDGVACAIIKHTNPCGAAVGKTAFEAFLAAYGTDPLSAFGGIIGFTVKVDSKTAEEITKTFFECVIAPDYEPQALEIFKKKPNLRILKLKYPRVSTPQLDFKRVSGGMLAQEKDILPKSGDKVMTKKTLSAEETKSLAFAWKICQSVKSNAIVLARGTVTVGIGAGQTSRIDSLKIALEKMNARCQTAPEIAKLPLVMASDAFFPFRDCIDEAAKAGVTAVIQPGGSLRDQESITACDEHGMAMVFTGDRHFRH